MMICDKGNIFIQNLLRYIYCALSRRTIESARVQIQSSTLTISNDQCNCVIMEGDGKEWVASEASLFAEHEEAREKIMILLTDTAQLSERHAALSCLRRIFDKYLECPTLLDPYLEEMVSILSEAAIQRVNVPSIELRFLLSALYSLAKVSGRKRIQRFLTHEVRHVEPVMLCLQNLSRDLENKEFMEEEPLLWESIYVMWIWMGMLSLVPFSSHVMAEEVVPTMLALGKLHLSQAGPIQETAAACLASWLARPDLETKELSSFIEWSKHVLEQYHSSHNIFQAMGVLKTLANILKVGQRTEALVHRMETLWEVALQLSESCNNMLVRKLMTKWLSRMGCAYLPPRIAKWRYNRGRRTLLENLNGGWDANTSDQTEIEIEEDIFLVPDPVEDAMGHMISSLQDSSTVVRWSAAKGIGRLTERLPVICADDVLDALLGLFDKEDKDHAWHGACLAMAELARRGSLLPSRLCDVVPVIVKAIQFDVRRGQNSVGAHVRDAACYTYWAFARAYSPNVIRPYVSEVSQSIIIACLFDREVNCRRAASAAFQECVGRQGADNFHHGIDILTAADYFSLGNRSDAYTRIALFVAQFEEYRSVIISHLYTVKLFHWDRNIRQLSAISLRGLASLDPAFMKRFVIPYLVEKCTHQDLIVRHGALLGLAEVILALGQTEYEADILVDITELVTKIEKLRLYRGRGGEIMRSAVCRFIECFSSAKLHLTVKYQVRCLDSIDMNLRHANEEIQLAASNALAGLMNSYFPVGDKGPSDRLQKRVVDKYIDLVDKSDHPGESRGYALGLGALPAKLLAPSRNVLANVLECLCKAARFDACVGNDRDAETRRNALKALANVCETVTIDEFRSTCPPSVGLSKELTKQVFESFILALNDYNMDRRGDVGSWSRLAAMDGLETLTFAAVEANNRLSPGYFDSELCVRIIGGLLKQLSEKLDSIRARAGMCLTRILTSICPVVPFIPRREYLLNALGLTEKIQINWSSAESTFRLVMNAGCVDEFFYDIIKGLVPSVGGLAKSVARYSEEALLAWTRDIDNPNRANQLGMTMLDIFQRNQNNRRITLPLLKMFEKLFNKGLFDSLVVDKSVFSLGLIDCLKCEIRCCSDVHRLLGTVGVANGLLSSLHDEAIRKDLLRFLLSMLGHGFPRVRRFTADQMYVSLLEDSSIIPTQSGIDGSLNFLLTVHWEDDSLTSDDLKDLVVSLSALLGVSLPLNTLLLNGHPARTPVEEQATDEFDTYASLVNDIMN